MTWDETERRQLQTKFPSLKCKPAAKRSRDELAHEAIGPAFACEQHLKKQPSHEEQKGMEVLPEANLLDETTDVANELV